MEKSGIYKIKLANISREIKIEREYREIIRSVIESEKMDRKYKIAYILYKTYKRESGYDEIKKIIEDEKIIDIKKIEFIKEKYDFIDKINMNYINNKFNIEDYQNCILIYLYKRYKNEENMTFEEVIVKYMLKNKEKENNYKKYKIKYIKLKHIKEIWNQE
jgi:hypothetical protein